MKSYKIELLPSNVAGAGDTMFRLGRKFTVKEPQVFELTKEQAEVFENDWRFKIENSRDRGEAITSGDVTEGDTVPSAEGPAAEETIEDTTETVEDTTVKPQEEISGETEGALSIEDLLRDYSRDELNSLALELGVDAPETLPNKTEVAQAIVNAR